MRRQALIPLVVFLLPCAVSGASAQQVSGGAQAAWGTDTDFGMGGRAIVDLGFLRPGLETMASFDWFFPGRDRGLDLTYWEANANVVYRFGVDAAVTPFTGAGLNYFRFGASTEVLGTEVSGDEGEAGLNLLAGLLFRFRGLRPFVEGRLELGGGEQFVMAAGIRL